MIWPKDISFEAYGTKKDEWFNDPDHFLGDPPKIAAKGVEKAG